VATLSLLDPQASLTAAEDDTVTDLQSLSPRLVVAAETTPTRNLTAGFPDTSAIENDRDVLVTAAVNGDPNAIEGVLRWIRPLVVRYCRSRVGSQEKTFASADDVAQEVCLAVLTALPSYRDQGRPFLAFVYGIASHKVADARRSAARNRAEPVPDVPDTTDLADGPEAQVMQGEFAGRMARLLESVSDRQRDILHLRVVVGLSVEETAEAVGSTPGAVRVAQHRALNRLRAVLTAKPPTSAGVQVGTKTAAGKTAPHLESFTKWTA
jgi:RNA polymerase sigma-70 factor (ECF subfamily)